MDMLSRRQDRYKFYVPGRFFVGLQQAATAALAKCQFPTKTPNEPDRWNWIHCQIQGPREREPLELIVPDMAGEVLFEELDHPQSSPLVRAYLGRCSGIMILVDAVMLNDGSSDHDYMAMKIIGYLAELDRDRKHGWRMPVAVVFTKADECELASADPEQFASTHAVGLWRQCRDRLTNYKYFAAGIAGPAAGAVAPGRLDARTAPHRAARNSRTV